MGRTRRYGRQNEVVALPQVLALQSAVATLSGDLQALAKNTEPGREPMLKTNARDALRGVERSIEALSPSTKSLQSAPVADAIGEAKALVAEVSELLSK